MKGYESVIITSPELEEGALTTVLDKLKQTVTNHGGEVQQYHLWGRRRLAYEIQKHKYGTYHIFYLTGSHEMLDELDKHYRYSEDIIRYQTIKVDNIQEEADKFLEFVKASATVQESSDTDGDDDLDEDLDDTNETDSDDVATETTQEEA